MLLQLQKRGYEVEVLGATIFDAPRGAKRLESHWEQIKSEPHIQIKDGTLKHHIVNTKSSSISNLKATEIDTLFGLYRHKLDTFKPDLIYTYGGKAHDWLLRAEAKLRGIPIAFYLANGNYQTAHWCRDVDLIMTDSYATAEMYKQRSDIDVQPIGSFIDPGEVIAKTHTRERILFVNPSPAKGAFLVVQIAKMLEKERPDIKIEIIDSRGSLKNIIETVRKQLKLTDTCLENIIQTPMTDDMREVYQHARLVLHPSLWWESSSRVLAEAMLNGIPAIITDRGGQPDQIGDAGIKVDFPEALHEAPYNRLAPEPWLQPIVAKIIELYDNEQLYQQFVARAFEYGRKQHHIEVSTDRLIEALNTV
ncbi:glycosyltransferase family 4 protein [Neptuniibacter sp.]|uniref:glycosyltransferase family 4 protein n=1 Tax=Neptuniibacter sp. TaxID=1962643 RepID=UPI002606A8FC|nr:glycosyltransferase family 4 protein [Neptuniibacter sp.]MCP4598620.1 glycosyltransferase family 4 protein [Neptuniibacter sp.]